MTERPVLAAQIIANQFLWNTLLPMVVHIPIFQNFVSMKMPMEDESLDSAAVLTHATLPATFVTATGSPQTAIVAPVEDNGITESVLENIIHDLRSIIEAMLDTHLSLDQPFMEAGLDSLSAVELRSMLIEKFGIELPATVMFDYASIQALAEYILKLTKTESSLEPDIPFIPSSWVSEVHIPSNLRYTDMVGISCRYPKQNAGLKGFWATVMSARNVQERIPHERWEIDPIYAVNVVSGTVGISAPFAAFCENVNDFDASLFAFPAMEAVTLDPQQRILIEEAQGALEDAAERLKDVAGSLTGEPHVLQMLQPRCVTVRMCFTHEIVDF